MGYKMWTVARNGLRRAFAIEWDIMICDALRDFVAFLQFKNVKNTHGGVLLLVKFQVSACNFIKSNITPWVLFTYFKLCKCYQILQSVSYLDNSIWMKYFAWFSRETWLFYRYYSPQFLGMEHTTFNTIKIEEVNF